MPTNNEPAIGLAYIQPQDIVQRISRRKPYWFHGNPKIKLIGNDGQFGTLEFDFIDMVLQFRIFIKNRSKILDVAHHAIMNFGPLSRLEDE